ncbi:MAG: ATP-binding cassette domain-containing protein [Pseudomonadota bacterium]
MPFDFSFVRADLSGRDCRPIELSEVGVAKGGRALIDDLNLSIGSGRRTVLMGPNGAGKSLTLRLLQGAIAPDKGVVTAGGRPLDASNRKRIGLVLQRPILLRRSVRANLDHALRAQRVAASARRDQIEELLTLAGLEHRADAPARGLSGGEQQRLSIVRALAAEPDVLLLDEPTASLDPHATQSIERLIDQTTEAGVKVVLVTHDCGQARRLADEVLFLHQGRLAEHTPAATFFKNPVSEPARAYLAGRLVL